MRSIVWITVTFFFILPLFLQVISSIRYFTQVILNYYQRYLLAGSLRKIFILTFWVAQQIFCKKLSTIFIEGSRYAALNGYWTNSKEFFLSEAQISWDTLSVYSHEIISEFYTPQEWNLTYYVWIFINFK